jgi:predicted Zn finger-like uncharacterized protein
MSMVTSCPTCTTIFRVTTDQLKQRQGKVRCGQCSGVFDAFKTLATLPDAPLGEDAPDGDGTVLRREAGANQGSLDIDPDGRADSASRADHAAAKGRDYRLLRARVIWPMAVLVLLLALLAQLAYAFRDTLGTSYPGTRPVLERLCALTGCALALPKRADLLAIEASDLQADPMRANIVVLTAALRNRGNTVVAHPALELTLTNTQDQAIARRIFLPADYLPRPDDGHNGMSAHAAIDVRIELDTADLRPAGYRLFVFYP